MKCPLDNAHDCPHLAKEDVQIIKLEAKIKNLIEENNDLRKEIGALRRAQDATEKIRKRK